GRAGSIGARRAPATLQAAAQPPCPQNLNPNQLLGGIRNGHPASRERLRSLRAADGGPEGPLFGPCVLHRQQGAHGGELVPRLQSGLASGGAGAGQAAGRLAFRRGGSWGSSHVEGPELRLPQGPADAAAGDPHAEALGRAPDARRGAVREARAGLHAVHAQRRRLTVQQRITAI
ncbi:hypothetical protein D910_06900, partial [Dendroctonus ponderosae]